MTNTDLSRLLQNFSTDQIETLSLIAVRIAAISAEKFTGSVSVTLHANQGSLGDTHIRKDEVLRLQKKRGIRSGGL